MQVLSQLCKVFTSEKHGSCSELQSDVNAWRNSFTLRTSYVSLLLLDSALCLLQAHVHLLEHVMPINICLRLTTIGTLIIGKRAETTFARAGELRTRSCQWWIYC